MRGIYILLISTEGKVSRQKGKTDEEEEIFCFLDTIRDSGQINMFGAAIPLSEMYGIPKAEARKHLAAWMRSFENTGEKTNEHVG